MSNLDDFRLRIQDKEQPQVQNATGDGARTVYFLEAVPIIGGSETVVVGGTTYAQATGPGADEYDLNDSTGRVTFGVAPVAGVFMEMDFQSAIFTDAELTQILLNHGIVAASSSALANSSYYTAWKDIIEILMMDAQRRFKWSTIGGHDVDQRLIYRNLESLRDKIDAWEMGDIFEAGGMNSWAIEQANYDSDTFPGS